MGRRNHRTIARYIEEEYGQEPESFKIIKKYNPQIIRGYLLMRSATLPPSWKSEGALPRKVKELVLTAVEVALGRGKRGETHARRAIRLGATSREVFEAVSLCIWLAGMSTFVDSGIRAVNAAEDEETKSKNQKKAAKTA